MNPNQLAAFKAIEQAQQALKAGDRPSASQFAEQAAQLAPELEEVWLMMAALANPRTSEGYLKRALEINPQSERGQKGLIWAQRRLEQELAAKAAASQPAQSVEQPPSIEETKPLATPKAETLRTPLAAAEIEDTQPRPASIPEPVDTESEPAASKAIPNKKALARRRYSYLTILAALVFLIVAWAVWSGVTPATALLGKNPFASPEHGPAWAEVSVPQPAIVQQAEIIPTATNAVSLPSATPEAPSVPPTATSSPVPSATTIPATASPTATESPVPTATQLPTDIPPATATLEMASAGLASPTPLPTDTAEPRATAYTPATPRPNTAALSGAGAGEHWIDVDLTHQMVYAYEGNTVVNSFLVSTGTWAHPTVTGQYNIYVKYRYKDMSGPGYYLPNVPYTMFFYQGYALHGTYWHSNFGTPMSHGCVNLSIPDSEWIYNWSSVGTLVNVHY
ncbi:MAG: L,D-transpeptidase family protein [Chloroflexi bacterium]|nr:L,D-transpeptidase family protein [Chloroflexota bacterium]